ncbi:MAG: hypothetical protein DMF90_05630 [Acidobacteria bacterium]|nr:MAG: hypothetical protein DMF90_05630 [Acidobacteriota bacterium]
MLFNSFTFLAFFAVVAGVYYGLPHRARWMWLLGASLFFYGTFSVPYLVLLLGTTLVTHAMGLAIGDATTPGAKRAALTAGVVLVLSALFVFKYYEFFRQSADMVLVAAGLGSLQGWPRLSVAAIAGLSFYTFSSVSYLADVYRGRARPERHVGRFTLYASFFPKLLAGPLERAQPFLDQVDRPLSFDPERVSSGLQQMLWGLFKKVVIADRLAGFVDTAYQLPGLASPADLVLATYFFAFQLYCDFSGYSDLAIGAARVLGFDLMANFSRPYLSTSIQEFWAARWHLSLSAWLRDYLYIPLGGSRTSPLQRTLARRKLDVRGLGRRKRRLSGDLDDGETPARPRVRPLIIVVTARYLRPSGRDVSSRARHLGILSGGDARRRRNRPVEGGQGAGAPPGPAPGETQVGRRPDLGRAHRAAPRRGRSR